MTVKFFCDNCGKEEKPHSLTSLKPVVDKDLCPSCLTKLRAIIEDFWGDKK